MTFNQWLALIAALAAAFTAHKSIVLYLDHLLIDIRSRNYAAAKTDLVDLAREALTAVVTQTKETNNAQENSQQSQSSSEAPETKGG